MDSLYALPLWKQKLPLYAYLPKHRAMKAYRRIVIKLRAFVTLILDAGERSPSRFGRFIQMDITGWVPEPVWTWER
jgi:hypothetical protein